MQPTGAEPLRTEDPAEIGIYRLLGRLGEGGMGTVYLAVDGTRLVALKVVRSALADDAFAARFHGEVENARKVASFCTAQVLDNGNTADGRPYMVTEYIAGTTLNRQILGSGPLDAGPLHGVALGVAAALAAIHVAGLVHRDLKPANVILSLSGPRVIDFGIARALDASHDFTQAGELLGSPGWWAPEQVRGEPVTPSTDIFAWGCLVAYAGTGRHPYGQGNMMTLAARVLNGRPDLGALPAPLNDLVRQATDPDPTRRPTAQALLIALVGGALPPISPHAPEATRQEPLVPVDQLNRTLADLPLPSEADTTEEDPEPAGTSAAAEAPDAERQVAGTTAFPADNAPVPEAEPSERADRTATFATTGTEAAPATADEHPDASERVTGTAVFATTDKGGHPGGPTDQPAGTADKIATLAAAAQVPDPGERVNRTTVLAAADQTPGPGEPVNRTAVLAAADQIPDPGEPVNRTATLAAADQVPDPGERVNRTAVLAAADQTPGPGEPVNRIAVLTAADQIPDPGEPGNRASSVISGEEATAPDERATTLATVQGADLAVPVDRTAVLAADEGAAVGGASGQADAVSPSDDPLIRPPRSRSDRWLIAAIVVFAAFVVSVGVLVVSGDNAPRTAIQIAAQQAADGDVAKRVTVGTGFGVDLVVTRDPQCGLQDFEGVTASAGAFCVIPWSMVNTGGELAAIAAEPVLLDDSGAAHQPHRLSTPLPSGLRPGGRSDGMLVFDLPDDRSPARLQFGGGLEVAL
ncbi:serine/threonine-protein kinase [Herbidospora cretacea]|uniref:serine/threonine-protein kinase n=1 Tax=Herbidospora cretacea TaxID=28444 RepID=UPI0007733532|nr:serine/threonine-protein kinase [Herbidospora cretacea]